MFLQQHYYFLALQFQWHSAFINQTTPPMSISTLFRSIVFMLLLIAATNQASAACFPAVLRTDTTICAGQTITLVDQQAASHSSFSYLWSTGDTTATITVGPGTYILTVSNSNCGASSDTVVISNGTATGFLSTLKDSLCRGDSTQLLVTVQGPQQSGHWSSANSLSDTTSLNPYAKPRRTTTYYYNYDLDTYHPCPTRDSITIVNLTPSSRLGRDTTLCNGATLDLRVVNGGPPNPNDHYLWSTNDTTPTITVSASNTYSLTVTGLHNCAASDTIVVTAVNLSVNLGRDTISCVDLTFNAGNAGASYLWSDGTTGQTFTRPADNVDTTYSVVISSNGCSTSDTIHLSICEGIDELDASLATIYPNPSAGHFTLSINNNAAQDMTIEIISMTGKKELVLRHENVAGNYEKQFDLSSMAKGIYYIRLISANGIVTKTIAVQ